MPSVLLLLRRACLLLLLRSSAAVPAGSAMTENGGNWSSGFRGQIFVRCPDLENLAHQSVASCEEACDAKLHCNAINIDVVSGACALRACPCGTDLVPTGILSGFSAYRRHDVPCPPAPPAPLFAHAFGSGMVLQRGPLQARVFGNAPPGAAITVTVARQGDLSDTVNVSSVANVAGEWACLLPAMPASAGGISYSLTASLDEAPQRKQQLAQVVWGDVFVCGGQSNMELPLSLVNNHSLELAESTAFPWIRVAVVNSASSDTPLWDLPAPLLLPWQPASPAALGSNNSHSWGYFSATCWLTARNIAKMLGPSVPLGLVGSYVGGTPVESWTPGLNPADKDPEGHKFAVLYNAMIAPLTGMAIRAILFYQGENNSFRGGEPERWIKYATDFPLMIKRWREAWATNTGQSALVNTPFGFVQIGPRDCIPDADHQGNASGSTFYGGVRWSQTAFQYAVPNENMPNTFMAVAADLAEGYSPVLDLQAGCVHFGDKQDVGWRLALGVAKHVYGRDVVDTGPMVTSVRVEEAQTAPAVLQLHFNTTNEGIVVRNTSGFELSANGKDYFGATITTHDSSSVTLAAPSSMAGAVVSLRYILHDTPCINKTCAVYGSKTGLPSPPLVMNLPGHAGADEVGWNIDMTGSLATPPMQVV